MKKDNCLKVDNNYPDNLYITPISLCYKFVKPFHVSLETGDIIRRLIETTFKKIDKDLFFKRELSQEELLKNPDLKEYQKPPKGYSLDFEIEGEVFRITLNLFGRFSAVIPHLKKTAKDFLKPKFGDLVYVGMEDMYRKSISEKTVYPKLPVPSVAISHFAKAKLEQSKLEVLFKSPVCIGSHTHQQGSITFKDLIINLTHKANLINFFFCDGVFKQKNEYSLGDDVERIVIPSLNLSWKFYKIPNENWTIRGYTGNIKYAGNKEILNKYLPLLLIGQWIQAGEKTHYGTGKYLIPGENYSFV